MIVEALKWYMFKPDKANLDDMFFEKYKDYWVLTSQSVVEGGRPTVVAPPVRLIPVEDKNQLKATICEILDEEVTIIPGEVFDDPGFWVDESFKLQPLGLKSDRGFYKHSRGFWLKRTETSLHLEEWKKYRGGWLHGHIMVERF